MNCIIPGQNLKGTSAFLVLSKALQALSKIGDELYLEANEDVFSLITLNISKTVCAKINFLDSFFSSYEIRNNNNNSSSHNDSNSLTCKVHMKVFLPLFKGNLEKKLDFIKLEYDPSSSDFIIFKMKYKFEDMQMVHKLRLMETETLSIGITTDSGSNNICASSSLYNQLLAMFNISDDEITFEVTKNKVIARNYCIGAPYRPKTMRSQINLNSTEFLNYHINTETTINFSLKPFRTAIHFAEGFNLNIGFNFEIGGKPLAIIMKNPTFEVNFIVATLNPYNDMQSTMTTTSIPSKIITQTNNKAVVNSNITIEDINAMESENWDENIEIDSNNKINANNKENCNIENADEGPSHLDIIPKSPESPRSKRVKTVFGRCYDKTFNESLLGETLAENSDSS